jgi:non-specific serine/threonine protein kinase/serine/threonine-protein kinase
MSAEDRWQRLWSVFHSVRETPAGDRDAVLVQLCADDERLRADVLSLLCADQAGKTPLDAPPMVTAEGVRPLPRVGDSIGNYRLLSVMGRGGMGIVYEGLQEHPIRRRVALKLLRDELAHPADHARFEAERQALALLSHSHIARVFDGGTANGHPYFVMEHIDGTALTKWCDDEKLPIRARVELLVQACEAVQHAHQRGVIHRDLKPSNILVTVENGRPIPKVIDFGIAKGFGVRLSSESIETGAGTLLGTPEYMSPEQAMQGEVDTRADVYALGAILYELACGLLPFDFGSGTLLGAIERITRDDPPPPARRFLAADPARQQSIAAHRSISIDELLRVLRADLAWIISKAIERDRERRYGSAGELAIDLRRWLDDQPVLAGPPSGAYKLRKAIRRHRAAATAIAGIAAALILGLAGTTWMAAVAAGERDAARAAGDAARREAAVAKATAAFVEQMLAAPDPGSGAAGAASARDVRVADVLGRAEKELTTLEREPEVAAALRHTLARSYYGLGLYKPAQSLLEQVIADRRRLLGHDHPATLAAQHDLALAYKRLGDERAPGLARRTYEARERTLGRDHEDTITSLDEYADQIRRSDLPAAERLTRDALQRSRGALGEDARLTMAVACNLSQIFRTRGSLDEAERLNRDVYTRRLKLLGADHPDTINVASHLATILYERGATDESLQLFTSALAGYQRAYGPDHNDTLSVRNNLAVLFWMSKRFAESEKEFREIVATYGRTIGPESPSALRARYNLARVVLSGGNAAESAAIYRELLPVAEKKLTMKDADLANIRMGYAMTLADLGRRAEGERLMAMAHRQLVELFGPDDKRTKVAADRLAALKTTGRIASR